MNAAATGDTGGFAKLPNALVERGILAHLRPEALKVYLAILLAARSKTFACFPSVKTLARWSGVPRGKVSEATDYLERHKLIEKRWLKLGGNPRRVYRVIQPTDPMYPDHQDTCVACMSTDHRDTCVVRDPLTGRLQGRRSVTVPPPLQSRNTDHRDSYMNTDGRDTNQTEADEKVLSRRGGGVGEPDGDARFASPRSAAPLASPDLGGDPAGEPEPASKGSDVADAVEVHAQRFLARGIPERQAILLANDMVQNPGHLIACAMCRRYAERGDAICVKSELTVAVDRDRRCEATTRDGLACVGRPVVGSAFCKRHQTRRETACAPVA